MECGGLWRALSRLDHVSLVKVGSIGLFNDRRGVMILSPPRLDLPP